MTKPLPADQLAGFVRKRVPGRQGLQDLERLALHLGRDTDDGRFLADLADKLSAIRQAVHGGSLHPQAHWWEEPS